MPDTITDKLERARRSLLDLTRRNRLLNFKPRGHTSLQIVDEIPSEVYRTLATDERSMQFLALEESELHEQDDGPAVMEVVRENTQEDAGSEESSFDLASIDDTEVRADRHTDLYLQTPLAGETLQRRLLHLSREARSALEERGCNILYLAAGLLQWADEDDRDIVSRAPLLFVPVELTRRTANTRFSVRLFDDSPEVNRTLAHLLRQGFGLDLPELDAEAEDPVVQLFDAVRAVIADRPGWSLIPEIHLGLFSFAKLLMYLDADDRRWPEGAGISHHPLVRSVLGEGVAADMAQPTIRPEELDDKVSPHETFQVLDADSSQQAAIIAAKAGCSMVIEGPPGTGKSQTITNIIAECLSEDKKVLFVAEKAAALEVVKRRLETVGLGDFVAELHSRKASKRAFLEDLRRSLAGKHQAPAAAELNADELHAMRTRLNDYVRTLHTVIEPLGLSPYAAISQCAALAQEPEAPYNVPDVTAWDRSRYERAVELVASFSRAVTRIGSPGAHPWRGVRLDDVPLHVRQKISSLLQALESTVSKTMDAAGQVASQFGVSPPEDTAACVTLLEDVDSILAAPVLAPEALQDSFWDDMPAQVRRLVDAGRELGKLTEELCARWQRDAQREDWRDVRSRYRAHHRSLLRWLRLSWWRDRAMIRRHLLEGAPVAVTVIDADLDRLARSGELRDEIRRRDEVGRRAFGGHWAQGGSEWVELSAYADAAVRARRLVRSNGGFADGIRNVQIEEAGRDSCREAADLLQSALDELGERWCSFCSVLDLAADEFFGGPSGRTPFERWRARLQECAAASEQLSDWTAYRRARCECECADTRPFAEWVESEGQAIDPDCWSAAFRRQLLRLWLEQMVRDRSVLREFRGEDHSNLIEEFRRLDRRWLELSRSRLASKIAKGRPRIGQSFSDSSALGRLEAELRRKRRIKPIRPLLSSAMGSMIQKIKPCFMMSPISVAQFLEPGALEFDVVIFDEASQVEVADALGAIARGKQLILVGDEKQLPPTNFFATVDSGAEVDEDDLPVGDLESVLALGYATLPCRTTLSWHYRSRHESLISFSNEEFYDGHLRVFPSPVRDRAHRGLAFRHVSDGIYDRSRARHNVREAQVVAEAVVEHARTVPHLSLGVGAFSKAQQTAIEDAVEALRRKAPEVEAFFARHDVETFFVKNLETIQGDERDVIFLSVGYGPDASGRFPMNFGPVNKDGGWRRLNVLVTRARERCVVFSSITADQIRVGSESPRGVVALKRYLEFAQAGARDEVSASAPEDGSSLAGVVETALRAQGWEIARDIGCAGFAVDVAVVDPKSSGRFLLGVESDGRTYRSYPTARDRDRTREAVLERMGWKVDRLWSMDWLRQPAATLSRIAQRAKAAAEEAPEHAEPSAAASSLAGEEPEARGADWVPDGRPEAGPDVGVSARAGPSSPPPGIQPYRRYTRRMRGGRKALMGASGETLTDLLVDVIGMEGPIHGSELFRVACGVYGTRARGEVRGRLAGALDVAVRTGRVCRRGLFVWPQGMELPPVRWRGGEDAVTSADLICVEEVAETAVWVAEHEHGVPRTDLAAATVRAMGFKRVGARLAELAQRGADQALRAGRIRLGDDGLIVAREQG